MGHRGQISDFFTPYELRKGWAKCLSELSKFNQGPNLRCTFARVPLRALGGKSPINRTAIKRKTSRLKTIVVRPKSRKGAKQPTVSEHSSQQDIMSYLWSWWRAGVASLASCADKYHIADSPGRWADRLKGDGRSCRAAGLLLLLLIKLSSLHQRGRVTDGRPGENVT